MHTAATQLLLVFVLGAAGVFGEEYVRVESPSDGRSYIIDSDRTPVRRSLRLVAGATAAAKLPAWLYPGADIPPSDVRYDPGSGIAQATFRCGGTETQVIAFYSQAMRAQGLRVSTVQLQEKRGMHISGSNDSLAVGVRVERQAGSIAMHVTYTPRQAPKDQHFAAVWYDDRTGILRLRDTSTGDEYEMGKRAIQENNLNRPGGIASDDEGMPPWLPVYPGANPSPPGRIVWPFEPTAEFVTPASIRQVYDYYLAAVRAAGAAVASSQMTRSGAPAQDLSAKIIARKDDGQVEIQIGQMAQQTGIGVRYTVPLR